MSDLIAVYSPKGGVGKTTIVDSLADVASSVLKTCIVEMDFSPGDFACWFDLDNNCTIEQAIEDTLNLETYLKKPQDREFSVLLGSQPDVAEIVEGEKLRKLLYQLKQNFELVIVDCQPTLNISVIDTIDYADQVLYVVEGNKVVLGRGLANLDYIELHNFATLEKFKLIINKKRESIPYSIIARYNIPLFKNIPLDKNLIMGDESKVLRQAIKEMLVELYPDKFTKKKSLFSRGE